MASISSPCVRYGTLINGKGNGYGKRRVATVRATVVSNDGKSQALLLSNGSPSLEKELARVVRSLGNRSPVRVAYQGCPGAYSEAAAMMAHPGCHVVPCNSCEDAIVAVETRRAERAILSVESTLEGNVVRNYDLLLHHSLTIVQEIQLFVYYCLLAMPGVAMPGVRRVISHPMALAHCGATLAKLGLEGTPVDDTAGAAELLLSGRLTDTAAIASCRAAGIYGLRVLARGVQDEKWNVTRFLVLARQTDPTAVALAEKERRRSLKTSVVVAHGGGGLDVMFKVLSAFSKRKISLAKFEVKRHKSLRVLDVTGSGTVREFEHAFYIDFEGSVMDPVAQSALNEIREATSFVRVLGCYAADSNIYSLD